MKLNYIKSTAILLLLIVSEISFSQTGQYGKLSYNKAINIAGKQRMLTQKMGKIYLYLLTNPNDFKAKKDLKITKIIFEKQNLILEKNSNSILTKNNIKEVKETWEKYKNFIETSPNKSDAVKIINTNSTLLKYTNNVVNSVILESKGSTNFDDTSIAEEDTELKQIINKSGKQRMLSQRLALYYFANKSDLKTTKTNLKLQTIFTELNNTIDDLLVSSFNNDRVDEALGDAIASWEDISTHKERLFKQGYKDDKVYILSNNLTKSFNKVTNLYEKMKIE